MSSPVRGPEDREVPMRAVRCVGGDLRVQEVPVPTGSGVPITVAAAGVCGSDLHLVENPDLTPDGITLGHEIAGYTDQGVAVAVEPLAPCGSCEPCQSGEYNLCLDSSAMIIGIGIDGGMADQVLVPERSIVPLPAGLEPRDATLVEPLAVLIHSFRRGDVRPDQRVAVIGGGTIGLCAVAVARAHGCEVGLAARHDAQRAAGERLGASELSGEYDFVVEAAGTESALATAVDVAKPSAQVAIPGIYWGPIAMPGPAICFKQISLCPTTLYARHASGRDIDNAAALLATTPDLASVLITHRFPLDAAAEAFATASNRSAGAIKVVLEP